MSVRDSSSDDSSQEYLSKKVSINGQTVTLYSSNGQTWFSSPEEIPEVMARLENARILLNDPKGEAPALPPKATSAKYRLRGPKPRPILQTEGGPIKGTPVEPVSASSVEVKIGGESIEVVSPQTRSAGQLGSSARKAEPAKQHKKLVAPVSTGPKPQKNPVVKPALAGTASKGGAPKKVVAARTRGAVKPEVAGKLPKESKVQTVKAVAKKAERKSASKASSKKAAAKKPIIKKASAVKKKR